MRTGNHYRLWLIDSKQPFSTDLLAAVFSGYPVELMDYNRAYTLTPSAWIMSDDLHALLEQDGYDKVSLVRGPQFNGSDIDIISPLLDQVRAISASQYPERLVHNYEAVAPFVNRDYNRHLLQDFVKDDELVQTLNSYCLNNCSATAAAAKLYVHRNTLLYRLEKIAELTGFDTRQVLETINLYYCLKQL